MKPCNIIYDGNYLFHSEFSIFSSYNKARFTSERDEIEFIQGVANKFFYATSNLPQSGRIVFCVDSKSWRKSIEIPGGGYKISRESDDGSKGTMDKETKEKFYKLMDEFSKCLRDVGIIVSRIPGAEGDDLLYKWSKHFYLNGENSIIISGDRDTTQTVKMPDEFELVENREQLEPWILVWNNNTKHNKLFAPEGWQTKWLSRETSVFDFNVADDRLILKKLIGDLGAKVEIVHPEKMIFDKILLGDDGDDVPAAWSYMGKTKKGEPKKIRLTDSYLDKVWKLVQEKYRLTNNDALRLIDDQVFLTDLAGIILRVMGDVDGSAEREKVVECIKRNEKLVRLADHIIPANLQNEVDDHITESLDTRTFRNKWNRKGLFEGSRFSENAPPKRDDPFAFFKLPDL